MKIISANVTDSELTKAINNANSEAFKILYYRYYEPLFRFLRRQINNDENCKELLQEVFVRVWKNRENLDPKKPIKAYLYRIAYNLVVDHRRKKAPATEPLDNELQIESPVALDEGFELREKIQAAIDRLPEPLRIVFTMNRFESMKYSEIAEALAISVKTVESRMSKSLKALREELRPFLMIAIFLLPVIGFLLDRTY